MNEYLISGSTLKAIADAIRAKTGSSELITVKSMASCIENISGGGGGDHTITFMSEDGSTLLGEKPVINGDTSGCPVALGLIEEPIKEPTAELTYGFVGWSSAPGGEPDPDILKNITSDKTVYAAFVGVVRLYTIRFLDGDEVLHSYLAAYGSVPSYEPEKTGYLFAGWDKPIVAVTSDMDYYAQWQESETVILEGACGTTGVNYSLTSFGILTLSGAGQLTYSSNILTPWYSKLTDIRKVIIDGDIRLSASAFQNYTALQTVIYTTTLSETNAGLYKAVFSGCTLLSEVTLPEGLGNIVGEAFKNCTSLKTITFPKSLKKLFPNAFVGSGLETAVFPSGSWKVTTSSTSTTAGDYVSVTNPTTNAVNLTTTYVGYYWNKQ